jgi:hypothetical protein
MLGLFTDQTSGIGTKDQFAGSSGTTDVATELRELETRLEMRVGMAAPTP